MDANRFDTLARQLTAPASRRSTLGALLGAGLLNALGLARAVPETRAAKEEACTLAFVATVRQGPSFGQVLTAGGTLPSELRGELAFSLSETGSLAGASLRLPDGTILPVVGQATGHALQVRIGLGERQAVVAVGVAEQEVAACQGAIDGPAVGPQVGDLGDWHAAVVRKGEGTGAAKSTGEKAGGEKKGGKKGAGEKNRGGNAPGAPASGGKDRTKSAEKTAPAAPAASGGSQGPAGATGATGSTGATAPGAESAQCASGQARCGDACVDLSSNLNNCGACGSVCESTLVPVRCRDGVCERASCPVGIAYCGAVDGCRDLASDPKHCGACQHPCPSGVCTGGTCAPDTGACAAGLTECAGVCVDLNTDDDNCGTCGNACGPVGPANPGVYTFCQDGQCVAPQCPPGTTDCANYCADLNTSPVHCGACGNACAADQVCQGGVCSGGVQPCAAGLTACSGVCVDLANDGLNCGTCGLECAYGEQCGGGACQSVCPQGLSYCNGVCVDTSSDLNNCGFCGIACTGYQDCQGGQCVEVGGCATACAPPLTACGCGNCVDLASDAANCGACGNSCPLGGVCSGGVCQGGA